MVGPPSHHHQLQPRHSGALPGLAGHTVTLRPGISDQTPDQVPRHHREQGHGGGDHDRDEQLVVGCEKKVQARKKMKNFSSSEINFVRWLFTL